MALVRVAGVSLQENGSVVLQEISFTQERLQKLAVAGASGAGKSTLLQTVAGLVQPTAGEVWVDGRRVRGPQEQLVPGHPGVAYLSQHFELPKFLRVEQVLRYANTRPALDAAQLYQLCRIEHLLARRTNELSGGERQRIALARLLLAGPQLLLLDEPFSNLDRAHKRELQAVLAEASTALGITCTLVSHDPADLLSWADDIVVLRAGRVVQQGPPPRIYQQPADEYTAGLFGDYQLLTGRLAAALARQTGPRRQHKPLLVRPENVRLLPAGAEGLPGTVAAVRYFGSYWEAEVRLANGVLRARTSDATLAPGAAVAVALVGPEWYL